MRPAAETLPILASKLFTPPLRPTLVSRSRLIQRLNEGLSQNNPLFLISAPAGFGKTTLVCEWLRQANLPSAWLALDETDNDPLRFWRYIVAALQNLWPNFGAEILNLLNSGQSPALTIIITLLANELAASAGHGILVLDDYHLIDTEQIHASLNYLLDHLPPSLNLLVLCRADPPLQLARRRGRAQLNEIRAADLRFSLEETTCYLNQTLRLGLKNTEISALEDRTEGWIAGLQMAALAIQSSAAIEPSADRIQFVTGFSGDDRFIADYLVEEVLQHQPPHLLEFLLKTSVIERLTAPLCDTLTGRTGSQEILNELDRANLFIVPLDNRRECFRYHHLFAALLRQHLKQVYGPAIEEELQRTAVAWYEKNGQASQAIEIALTFKDSSTALRLLDQLAPQMFMASELNTLLKWASAIPQEIIYPNIRLCIILAWAASATGQPALCELYVCAVENAVGISVKEFLSSAPHTLSIEPLKEAALIDISAIRIRLMTDNLQLDSLDELSERLMFYLTPEQDQKPYYFNLPTSLRPPLVFIRGFAKELTGEFDAATGLLRQAAQMALEPLNIHIIALALSNLGCIYILRGQLDEANAVYNEAQHIAQLHPEQTTGLYAFIWVGLGCVYLEKNDLKNAEIHLRTGLRLARLWNQWEAMIWGYPALVRLFQAQADLTAAQRTIDEMIQIGNENPRIFQPTIETTQALFMLQQGQSAFAHTWLSGHLPHLTGPIPYLLEPEALCAGKMLVCCHRYTEAFELLSRLAAICESNQRHGRLIEIWVYQSLAETGLNKTDEALSTLTRALELAAPAGFHRIFLDQSKALKPLWSAWQRRNKPDHPLNAFVQKLNTPFAPQLLTTPSASVEALTEREIEIVHLMAAGAANADIARQLVLSILTVKKHINNIFGKLGVTTRIQAVERARALKYL